MAAKKQSLLWQITHPDLPFPSYLFGTMHMRRLGYLPILPTALHHMASCKMFLAEMDLEAELPTTMPSGKDWYAGLSDRKFDRMARMIHKLTGASTQQIRFLPPLYWVNSISTTMVTAQGPVFYLDQHLWKQAGRLQMERGGLETVEEQAAIYLNIQLDQQLKMLLDITRNVSRFRKHLLAMNKRYEQGDLHQLYQSTRTSMGKLRRSMLYNRNRIMAARLIPHLFQAPVFVAVGAAHLPGYKGILRLLKEKGFRNTPLLPDTAPPTSSLLI
jgi:uncharacterized protein YbaP (TraB family)